MILVTLGVAAVSAVLISVLGLPQRSFLPALTLGNTGNLGLPLCLFAFGEEGLGLAVAIYVTNSLLQFTFVPLLHTRVSVVRTLFSTPMLYGAVAGPRCRSSRTFACPSWLANTLGAIGDLLIPLMLMALGNTIGGLKTHNLPRALGLGAARLVISFVVAVGVSFALGLTRRRARRARAARGDAGGRVQLSLRRAATSAMPTTSRASCSSRRCSARSRCRCSCRTRSGSRAEARRWRVRRQRGVRMRERAQHCAAIWPRALQLRGVASVLQPARIEPEVADEQRIAFLCRRCWPSPLPHAP